MIINKPEDLVISLPDLWYEITHLIESKVSPVRPQICAVRPKSRVSSTLPSRKLVDDLSVWVSSTFGRRGRREIVVEKRSWIQAKSDELEPSLRS